MSSVRHSEIRAPFLYIVVQSSSFSSWQSQASALCSAELQRQMPLSASSALLAVREHINTEIQAFGKKGLNEKYPVGKTSSYISYDLCKISVAHSWARGLWNMKNEQHDFALTSFKPVFVAQFEPEPDMWDYVGQH